MRVEHQHPIDEAGQAGRRRPATAPKRVTVAERFQALDAIAVRAQAVRDPGALFPAVGDALLALGLGCYIAELQPGSKEIAIRYSSVPAPLRQAIEVMLGQPIDGLRIAVERVPSLSTAMTTGQGVYLADPREDIHAAVPWLPRATLRYIARMLGIRSLIVAPLLATGAALGALVVWGHNLDEGDVPFLTSLGTHVGEALAAARTLEAARRREAAAVMLGELSARVAAGTAAAELPAIAVHSLRPPLGASAAAVWLLDADTASPGQHEPVLRLAAHAGLPPSSLAAASTIPLSADRLVAQVVREGRTSALQRQEHEGDVAASRAALADGRFGLAIIAPLRVGHQVFGALGLMFADDRPAPPDERAFVEAVAVQIAATLENARLLAETRTQATRAALLADLAALFNRSLDTATLLETLARRTAEVLNGTAVVYRTREGQRQFEVAAIHHPDPAIVARTRRALDDVPPQPGVGVLGHAYEERRPMLVRFDDPTLPPLQRVYAERLDTNSAIAIPLLAHGQSLGVLAVTTVGRERPFGQEDLALATAIGALAAQSLDNARAYAAADEGHRRLDATFQSMIEAVFLYDAQGRVIDLNEAALHLLGLSSREEALRPAADYPVLLEMRHADGRPVTAEDVASLRAVRGETVVGHEEILCHKATGEERRITVNAAPIHDETGRIAGAVLVAHDVTALRAAERIKDEFISMASHELKTPLTPLKGFMQIISDMVTKADQGAPLDLARLRRYLRMTNGRVDRLIELVNTMLDMSRLQQGSFALEMAPADLVPLAAEVLAGFDSSDETLRGVQHRLILDAPAPVVARCDAHRIDQVVTNLVTNALKYSPEGGIVRLRVAREGDQALIVVEDEGIGIPAGEEDVLFQPFTRGSNAPALQYAGVGLGLFICREIVERHGGRISAGRRDSTGLLPGTAMRVTLPLDGPHGPRPLADKDGSANSTQPPGQPASPQGL